VASDTGMRGSEINNRNITLTIIDVIGKVASATIKETGFAGYMAFTNYFHLINDAKEWKIISKTFATE